MSEEEKDLEEKVQALSRIAREDGIRIKRSRLEELARWL